MNATLNTQKVTAEMPLGNFVELGYNSNNQPTVKHYTVKSTGKNKGDQKVWNNFYFTSEKSRTDWMQKLETGLVNRENYKTEQSEAKAAIKQNMNHGFEVGQIVYDSWGYEQTNIDFYQIIAIKKQTVTLREVSGEMVKHTGHDAGRVKPLIDKFEGENFEKRIQFSVNSKGEANFYMKSPRNGWLSLYTSGDEGVYCSWGY